MKITGLTMGFVLLATGGAAAYAYWKLNGNIKSDDLSANGKDGAGHERPDAFGRTPVNILVIGSDGRTSSAYCKLGGACKQAGGRAGGRGDGGPHIRRPLQRDGDERTPRPARGLERLPRRRPSGHGAAARHDDSPRSARTSPTAT
ncbi:hypothetical protein [Actinacidiphila acidipaludis]|uniref:hypothetical protein n=1 Tax=Actinacidiphila acidipaludis TaxID=2873382 RepID=UPI00355834FD